MTTLKGVAGAKRDNDTTRSGRKHIQRLLSPSLDYLEEIVYGDPTCAHDRTEKRKTSQYIIDQNLGRAAFTIHGQLDIHKQEVVFKAFLAGGMDLLLEADKALLLDLPATAPGNVVEGILYEPAQAQEAPAPGDPPVAQEAEPAGTEPCDDP